VVSKPCFKKFCVFGSENLADFKNFFISLSSDCASSAPLNDHFLLQLLFSQFLEILFLRDLHSYPSPKFRFSIRIQTLTTSYVPYIWDSLKPRLTSQILSDVQTVNSSVFKVLASDLTTMFPSVISQRKLSVRISNICSHLEELTHYSSLPVTKKEFSVNCSFLCLNWIVEIAKELCHICGRSLRKIW